MRVHDLIEGERSILAIMGKQKPSERGFNCDKENITSLKGSPESVGTYFNCSENKLKSLDGISSRIGLDLHAYNNKIESLHNIHKQIKYIGRNAYFQDNPIKSHVLGLLLIDGLKRIWFVNSYNKENKLFKVEEIINKHLAGDRDIFACQEELIEAGFDEYAQL